MFSLVFSLVSVLLQYFSCSHLLIELKLVEIFKVFFLMESECFIISILQSYLCSGAIFRYFLKANYKLCCSFSEKRSSMKRESARESVKFSAISQQSVKLQISDLNYQLKKSVISQLTVTFMSDTQLSVNKPIHSL